MGWWIDKIILYLIIRLGVISLAAKAHTRALSTIKSKTILYYLNSMNNTDLNDCYATYKS